MLAVADKDEELVGAARLATGEYESATIGFALRPYEWGQGKGLETIRLPLRLGFTELGFGLRLVIDASRLSMPLSPASSPNCWSQSSGCTFRRGARQGQGWDW